MNNKEWLKTTKFQDSIVINAANHCRLKDKSECFANELAIADGEELESTQLSSLSSPFGHCAYKRNVQIRSRRISQSSPFKILPTY